jgi:SAM-dependent methyltransferase
MVNKKQHENFNHWRKVLQNTPESYKQWFEAEREFLWNNIRKINSSILEVGCGNGRSLYSLLHLGGFLYGIDNDENAVREARELLEPYGARISLQEAANLTFRDKSFDYVLSLSTPANFGSQKNKIYSEMRRVLKPDGEIIINVFNEDAFDERIKVYKALKAPIKGIKGTTVIFEDGDIEFISEQFSRQQLEEICKDNNLVPVDIRKEGIGYLCRFKKKG